MKGPYCYLNGKVGRIGELTLALNDLGVLRGFGVFDFMRTYSGKPFQMKEHLERFGRSAKKFGLRLPHSLEEIESITHTLIKKNNFSDTTIKFVITGGPSDDGMSLLGKPTFFILLGEAHNPPQVSYVKGVRLQTCEHQRLFPEIKSLNYIMSLKHQRELRRKGIMELLYVSEGKVLECSSSNIFIVRGNKLITPKNDVLIGTTRNFLIKHLAGEKYKAEERDVRVEELRKADEVFITASNKGVMPVIEIDSRLVGNGKVGPVTKELMLAYKEHTIF